MPGFCTTLGVAVLGTCVAKTGQRPSPDRPGRSWLQTEVSAEAAPCRAATGLRPTCTRRRGEDPQHLPPRSPPRHTRPHRARYPVMYTPLRERTRLPPRAQASRRGSRCLCASEVPTCPCVGSLCTPAPGVCCPSSVCVQRVRACTWCVCIRAVGLASCRPGAPWAPTQPASAHPPPLGRKRAPLGPGHRSHSPPL